MSPISIQKHCIVFNMYNLRLSISLESIIYSKHFIIYGSLDLWLSLNFKQKMDDIMGFLSDYNTCLQII